MPVLRQISFRGFSLIELMIAISIVAIISAVGLTSFSQSQKLGRDSRRKQDLDQIRNALSLYYQDNNRYPTPGTWRYSTGGTPWIDNLTSNYIASLPKDPLNSCPSGTLWGTPTCYIYGYVDSWAGSGGNCPYNYGQYYVLLTNLENTSDPQTNAFKDYRHCSGAQIATSPAAYAIVSTSN